MKYAMLWSHLGQPVHKVLSAFFHASTPPNTSSTSFLSMATVGGGRGGQGAAGFRVEKVGVKGRVKD